jgi:hypothetical protein
VLSGRAVLFGAQWAELPHLGERFAARRFAYWPEIGRGDAAVKGGAKRRQQAEPVVAKLSARQRRRRARSPEEILALLEVDAAPFFEISRDDFSRSGDQELAAHREWFSRASILNDLSMEGIHVKHDWDLVRESDWCKSIGICGRTARNWQEKGIVRPATYIAGQRWRRADERPRADDDLIDDEDDGDE